MAFDEVRFPVSISRGSSGGPERRTEIVATASGREERNSRWADSRRRYNAGFGVASLDDIHEVVGLLRGAARAAPWFPLEGPCGFQILRARRADCRHSTRQSAWAMAYAAAVPAGQALWHGARDYMRVIAKPVAGSVCCDCGEWRRR